MLRSGEDYFRSGKIRFVVVSTHHYSISGDALTHQKCLNLIKSCGGHIIAEHTVSESYSGDGLIAASFNPKDSGWTETISYARAKESLFGEPEYLCHLLKKQPLAFELKDQLEELNKELLQIKSITPDYSPTFTRLWYSAFRGVGIGFYRSCRGLYNKSIGRLLKKNASPPIVQEEVRAPTEGNSSVNQLNSDNSLWRSQTKELIIVDAGCRWGFADSFTKHIDKIKLFGFDPDEEECEKLEKLYSSDRITLVPLGLADSERKGCIHITKEPACSSVFEPIETLIENCPVLANVQKVKETEIQLTTLDLWADRSDIRYVDHIKIDTQGAELMILKGMTKLLRTVRSLEVEVEFNPIYKGQPLFADIDIFLRKRGFVLWKLTNLVHYGRDAEDSMELGTDLLHHNNHSQTIHMLGGQLFWADAHYIKGEIAEAKFTTDQQLIRDINLMECLNHLDLACRLRSTRDLITHQTNE